MDEIITRQCKEVTCKQPFEIEPDEAKFYQDKGYELPLRCKDCRARRKAEKEAAEQGA